MDWQDAVGAGAPDEWAAYLAHAVPGARTAGVLERLDPEKLSHRGMIDGLRALERHVAWAQAKQARLLAALKAEVEAELPSGLSDRYVRERWDFAAEEVACALKVTGRTAEGRLHVARELHRRLPTTLRLLERGEISWMQSKAVVEVTDALDPLVAREVEAAVAEGMPEWACGQTRRALRRAAARIDPAGAAQRHEARRRKRAITHRGAEDGMALWSACLPADQAAQLDQAVDARAETLRTEGDVRTLAQRRVDALVDLVLRRTTGGSSPGRTVVQVTVALDTLLGIGTEPGELKGYGPVTAAQARRLACAEGTVWRRLLTDPDTGLVVKADPVTYRPTAETARHVVARDGVCMFPSCRMPAHRCDLDHVRPFSAGGATVPENLVPLCRRHHLLKHRSRWAVERTARTGVVTWTAPSGHRYLSRPVDHRVRGGSRR